MYFWGSFSTSTLGRVGGASWDACVRFSDTPVAVFRTQPWPFFGHTRVRFSDTLVAVFRHDRVRFSDTLVSAFRFKKISPAIFFWAARDFFLGRLQAPETKCEKNRGRKTDTGREGSDARNASGLAF